MSISRLGVWPSIQRRASVIQESLPQSFLIKNRVMNALSFLNSDELNTLFTAKSFDDIQTKLVHKTIQPDQVIHLAMALAYVSVQQGGGPFGTVITDSKNLRGLKDSVEYYIHGVDILKAVREEKVDYISRMFYKLCEIIHPFYISPAPMVRSPPRR